MNKTANVNVEVLRHSFAHVLAQAVLRLFPNAKLGIGPAVEKGFYYEFDIAHRFTKDDLQLLEEEMQKIIKENLPFKQLIIPREQAFDTLHQLGQIYKTELLQQIPDDKISFYKTGEEFIDLCRGPHVKFTGELEFFKLTKISENYWLGDKSRPLMQKIEGVGFLTQEELTDYFDKQQELRSRNHMILGPELELFTYNSQLSKDLPIWLEKGETLRNELRTIINTELRNQEFRFIETPEFADVALFETNSYLNFRNKYFLPGVQGNNSSELLRIDSTPTHLAYYKSDGRSYRELPMRIAEYGNFFQKSATPANNGLLSSRWQSGTQSHIFCADEKDLLVELTNTLRIIHNIHTNIGLNDYYLKLVLPMSDQSQNYIANEDNWNKAIKLAQQAVDSLSLNVKLTEGDASFFGPELVFCVKDVFEREWELSRIVIDYNLPKISKLFYVDSQGNNQHPVVLHVNFMGSLEILSALLIEHFGGAFPIWLSPIQVILIAISEKYNEVVRKLQVVFRENAIRCAIDVRDETVKSKIRKAQLDQIPYMLIVGEKEIKTNSISVRPRAGQDLGLMRVNEFLARIKEEIASKNSLNNT